MVDRCEWCAYPIDIQDYANLCVTVSGGQAKHYLGSERVGFILCHRCGKTFMRMMRQGHATDAVRKENLKLTKADI